MRTSTLTIIFACALTTVGCGSSDDAGGIAGDESQQQPLFTETVVMFHPDGSQTVSTYLREDVVQPGDDTAIYGEVGTVKQASLQTSTMCNFLGAYLKICDQLNLGGNKLCFATTGGGTEVVLDVDLSAYTRTCVLGNCFSWDHAVESYRTVNGTGSETMYGQFGTSSGTPGCNHHETFSANTTINDAGLIAESSRWVDLRNTSCFVE